MQTHNILQLFEMPQIGYSATAKQLSDKEKFKYFTRVIASDTQQAQAIVDIIRQFRWSYVATIGTEGKFIKNKILIFYLIKQKVIMVVVVLKRFVVYFMMMHVLEQIIQW
jgi:hypothetical protein